MEIVESADGKDQTCKLRLIAKDLSGKMYTDELLIDMMAHDLLVVTEELDYNGRMDVECLEVENGIVYAIWKTSSTNSREILDYAEWTQDYVSGLITQYMCFERSLRMYASRNSDECAKSRLKNLEANVGLLTKFTHRHLANGERKTYLSLSPNEREEYNHYHDPKGGVTEDGS